MLVKMLLSYLLIGLILMSAFATVLYRSFSNSSMKQINETSQQMLEQSYNTADILLGSTYSYFYSVYTKNTVIFNALYSKSFRGTDNFEIGRELNAILIPNPLVYSVYLYNPGADSIFSNLDTQSTINDFYDSDLVHIIRNQKFNSNEVFLPRHVQYSINGNQSDIDLITIIFTDANKISGNESAMILNINQQTLQKMINKGARSDLSNSFIINGKGIIISHGDRSKLTQDIGNESYIKKILTDKKDRGSFTDTIDNKKYLISYIKSGRLGWYFINRSEYNQIFESMTTFQKFILLITTVFILMGILIAGYFTRKIYTPLHKLIMEIRAADTEPNEVKELSEYEYLKGSFNKLSFNINQLKEHVQKSSNVKRKELLRQALFSGIIKQDEFKSEMEQAGVSINAGCYRVIVLKFDDFNELKNRTSIEDLALYRFEVSNVANELLGALCKVEAYEDELDHVILILNSDSLQTIGIENIKPILLTIQQNVESFFGFSITAGIGFSVDGVKSIRESYVSATTSVNYRLVHGKRSMIDADDISELQDKDYRYPAALEKHVLDSLKLGNMKKLSSSLDHFFSSIQCNSYGTILLSLTQLTLMMVSTGKAMTAHLHESVNLEYEFIHKQLISLETLEEIKSWLFNICGTIIEAKNSKADTRKDETVNKLLAYIQEHFRDANLSVDEIAEVVSFSPNYVRTIFKNNMNESVSEYISRLRFEMAKQLLEETSLTVKDISKQVGFSDNRYFYTAFKKYYGMTPEEMRKSAV